MYSLDLSGSITRYKTKGLDRKEGLKFGGIVVVNSTASTNLAQAISLSALLGGSTINNAAQPNPDNANFKTLITNLMNTELNNEKVQLSIDTESNEKVKAALYQAASILYLMGSVKTIAAQDTDAISKDMTVANVMQENNLNPAERQLFLKGLKITAVEISASEAALNGTLNNTTTSNIAVLGFSTNQVASSSTTIQPQTLSGAASNLPSVISNTTTDNAVPANNAQTSAALNVMPETTNTQPLETAGTVTVSKIVSPVVSAPVSTGSAFIPADADGVTTVESLGAKYDIAKVDVKSAVNELERLVTTLQGVLDNIMQKHFSEIFGNEKNSDEAKKANEQMYAIKNTINELKSATDADPMVPVTQQQLDQAAKLIMTSMNNIIMSVEKMQIAGAAINGLPGDASADVKNAIINAINISSSGSATQDDGQAKNFTAGAAQVSDEFSAVVNKIFTLLKEMNGKIEISEKTQYAGFQPEKISGDAKNAPVVNQPVSAVTVNQVKPQAVVTPVITPVQSDETTVIVQKETGAAQVVVNTPDVKTADSNSKITVQSVNVRETASTVAPEAVKFAGERITVSPDKNYSPADKSLSKDIQWVTENVINPSIKEDTANIKGDVLAKALIFDKVTDFAMNIKEQIILKQVVSNIENTIQAVRVNEIKMILKPENLGSVMITIEHKDDKLKANIQVLNNDVKDALKANLPELKAALNSIGLKLDSFEISTANQGMNQGLGGQAKNPFKEWEGAALQAPVSDINIGDDPYISADGYLNYLA